jgi:hypothetical protein
MTDEKQEAKPVTQDTQTNIESQPDAVKTEVITDAQDNMSDGNKPNWAKFREEREKDRKARVEAEQRAEAKRQEAEALRAAMEALVNKNVPQQQQDQYQQKSDEERVADMVAAALAKERLKYEEERKKQEIEQLPNRLRNTYRDFDQVCSSENLDYLDYHHPKISQAYAAMPNTQEKWDAIYDTMKKLVPYANKQADSKRIEQNMMKPQAATPNLTDTTPKGAPWQLDEARKKANWERMQKDRKSFSMQ